jgi:hypothetical protein
LPAEETAIKAQALAERLQKVGEPAKISEQSPTLIVIKKDGNTPHAVDIHSNEILPGSEAAPAAEYGFKYGQKPVQIEGIDVMPLSEQGLRKVSSSMSYSKEGLGPKPHRLKDISDAIATQESLIRSMKESRFSFLREGKIAKAEKNLEIFKAGMEEKYGPLPEGNATPGMAPAKIAETPAASPGIALPIKPSAYSASPQLPPAKYESSPAATSPPIASPPMAKTYASLPSAGISMPASSQSAMPSTPQYGISSPIASPASIYSNASLAIESPYTASATASPSSATISPMQYSSPYINLPPSSTPYMPASSISPSAGTLPGYESPSAAMPSIESLISPSISPQISPGISSGISPISSPGVSPGISPNILPSISPSISPSASPGITSYFSPSISPPPSSPSPGSPSPGMPPYPKPPPPIYPYPHENKKSQETHGNPGYNVMVKRTQLKLRKGKYHAIGYVKANEKPLTREGAIGRGMEVTDTYANRSFKIEKAKGNAQSDPSAESQKPMREMKFTMSKKNRNIYVEESKYAIDSPQEKDKIPYEAARQRKKQIPAMSLPGRLSRPTFKR